MDRLQMPKDYYQFLELVSIKYSKGQQTLFEPFNFVFPNTKTCEKYPIYPPEYQCIVKDLGLLLPNCCLGYYRDDPLKLPDFVVCGMFDDCKKYLKFSIIGRNLLSSIKNMIELKRKSYEHNHKYHIYFKEILGKIGICALLSNIHLESTKEIENFRRERRCVIKNLTIHGAGIVSSLEKKQFGYHPFPLNNNTIIKILDNFCLSDNIRAIYEAFQIIKELFWLAKIAEEENEIGLSLELGTNLLCYGNSLLKPIICNLLNYGYKVTNRHHYVAILRGLNKKIEKSSIL